jgi:very-short-patch-repair endonuclease
MAHQILHDSVRRRQDAPARAWALVRRQHGAIARHQLLDLGYTADAIKVRVRNGRLHPVARGVYAVGRPELSRSGVWMAAILSCGPSAVLSHGSAAALWGIAREDRGIELSVPASVVRVRPGLRVHRRGLTAGDVCRRDGLPVTTVVSTIVDLAARLERDPLEAVINEADMRRLATPAELRAMIEPMRGRRGVPALRKVLDRRTFRLTRSKLERRFIPIALSVGLPRPLTRQWVNGYEVDFYWPELGLVVETDGLTYHRTPAQQAVDLVRDQAHTVAELIPLRFSHEQIAFERAHVRATLEPVARRLLLRRQVNS